MRIISTISLLALTATGAMAQSIKIERIDVTEYGTYTSTVMQAQRDANGVLQSTSTNVRHLETTRNIPAKLGVAFGFNFTVVGTPDSSVVKLRKVTVFPAELKPDTGKPISRSEVMLNVTVGESRWTSYRFDDPWELAPGVWTIELWSEDRKLLSESFTVVKPAPPEKTK